MSEYFIVWQHQWVWRRLTNCECHNNKKIQLNGNRFVNQHRHVYHTDHTSDHLINGGGSYKKSRRVLRFIWNSTAVQRCQNNNRCFCSITNTWAAPTYKTKAFFTDPSKTHLLQLNGAEMSSGIVHRWLQSWLCVTEWEWCETKWAECGGPLMRLEWNQIPIHASLEACVI